MTRQTRTVPHMHVPDSIVWDCKIKKGVLF